MRQRECLSGINVEVCGILLKATLSETVGKDLLRRVWLNRGPVINCIWIWDQGVGGNRRQGIYFLAIQTSFHHLGRVLGLLYMP